MLTMKTPDFEVQFENAGVDGKKQRIQYRGKLLLPGEDAAIVVTPDTVQASLDGVPAPADHKFTKLVARYETKLRAATANEFGLFHTKIVFLGRWHICGPDHKDFEPYIVHKIGRDGIVLNDKYDYEIFPFDGLGSGEGFYMDLEREDRGASARGYLTNFSEDITSRRKLSDRAAARLGLPMGLVWYPPNGSNFPILVTERSRRGSRNTATVDARQLA